MCIRDRLTGAQIALSTGTSGNSEIPYYDHLALVSGGPKYNDEAGIYPKPVSYTHLISRNVSLRKGKTLEENFELEEDAVADEIEPGSTFKVASIMVALEDGLCNPGDTVDVGNGIYMYKGCLLYTS